MQYYKGQEVVILNTKGERAGMGFIESYNINNNRYRVWFCYRGTAERELIEIPALLLVAGKAQIIFAASKQ